MIVVMGLIGNLAARLWVHWLANKTALMAIGLAALGLGFIPIALRGSIGDTLSRMLFSIVPFYIIGTYARVETMRSARRIPDRSPPQVHRRAPERP